MGLLDDANRAAKAEGARRVLVEERKDQAQVAEAMKPAKDWIRNVAGNNSEAVEITVVSVKDYYATGNGWNGTFSYRVYETELAWAIDGYRFVAVIDHERHAHSPFTVTLHTSEGAKTVTEVRELIRALEEDKKRARRFMTRPIPRTGRSTT